MKQYIIAQILLLIPLVFLFMKDDNSTLNSTFNGSITQLKIQPHSTSSNLETPTGSTQTTNKPQEKTPQSTDTQTTSKPPTETSSAPPEEKFGSKTENPTTGQTQKPEEKTPETTVQPEPTPKTTTETTSTPQQSSSVTSEFEPKVIFKGSSIDNDRCVQRNQRPVLLCRLGLGGHCRRVQPSEELSSWWMICPMYTANTGQTKHLYELHNNFRSYARSYGINFQTVEVVFPGQEFQLTKPNNEPDDLQYHAKWIFAMRENLVNVGIKHLPDDWQYMSWIDQHIFWEDSFWFEKAILAFSHWNIVHMLNGNDFWNLKNGTDYHLDGFGMLFNKYGMGFEMHDPRQCGLAWGMRREIFDELGGLFDLCIGTKCDLYQNYAYAGARYTSQASNGAYINKIGAWQDHAIQVYKKKLGYLDSKVYHFMHCYDECKTSDYNAQVWALMRYNYDPDHDLERDEEGRLSFKANEPLAKELWTLYGGAPRSRLLKGRAIGDGNY